LSADVKKYIGGDNVFEVHSPTAVAGVRGTGFEFIEARNIENKGVATISCTEGSLNLSALSATGEVVSRDVLEAGQVAVIIGGIITISKIAAAVGAGVAGSSKTGTAGAAGGAGTGTGGPTATAGGGATTATAAGSGTTVAAGGASTATATAAAAGTATAAAGLSTTAIAGIAIGTAAVLGGAAAAGGGGGGGGSSSGGGGGGGSTPAPSACSEAVGNWAGTMTGNDECGRPHSGNWTLTVNTSCIGIMTYFWNSGITNTDTDTLQNSATNSGPCDMCGGGSGTGVYSYNFSGNLFNGTWNGCGAVTNYSGSRQ
jgi:hypothetical protein